MNGIFRQKHTDMDIMTHYDIMRGKDWACVSTKPDNTNNRSSKQTAESTKRQGRSPGQAQRTPELLAVSYLEAQYTDASITCLMGLCHRS